MDMGADAPCERASLSQRRIEALFDPLPIFFPSLFDPSGNNRTFHGPDISSNWHRRLPFAVIFSLPVSICLDDGPYPTAGEPPLYL